MDNTLTGLSHMLTPDYVREEVEYITGIGPEAKKLLDRYSDSELQDIIRNLNIDWNWNDDLVSFVLDAERHRAIVDLVQFIENS